MKYITALLGLFFSLWCTAGSCNYPSDRDSAGRRCGGRAASVRPGGRLGGDGRYQDSLGRDRIYGRGNDPYDSDYSPTTNGVKRNTNIEL